MTDQPLGFHIVTWDCHMNEDGSEQIGLAMEPLGGVAVDAPTRDDVIVFDTRSGRALPEEKVNGKLGEWPLYPRLDPHRLRQHHVRRAPADAPVLDYETSLLAFPPRHVPRDLA
jgi:hypothetical protein